MQETEGCTDADVEKMTQGQTHLFAQGATYTGLYPSSLGFLYYHTMGNRVFITVNLQEAFQVTEKATFQEVVSEISQLGPDSDLELTTLRSGYLSPGDTLFVPAAHLCFERAVNAHNVGFRVSCPLLSLSAVEDLKLVDAIYPGRLVVHFKCVAFHQLQCCHCPVCLLDLFSLLPQMQRFGCCS